jgi:hypothetical protein
VSTLSVAVIFLSFAASLFAFREIKFLVRDDDRHLYQIIWASSLISMAISPYFLPEPWNAIAVFSGFLGLILSFILKSKADFWTLFPPVRLRLWGREFENSISCAASLAFARVLAFAASVAAHAAALALTIVLAFARMFTLFGFSYRLEGDATIAQRARGIGTDSDGPG